MISYEEHLSRILQRIEVFSDENGVVEQATVDLLRKNYAESMRIAGDLVKAGNKVGDDAPTKRICFRYASHALIEAKAIDAALKQFNL